MTQGGATAELVRNADGWVQEVKALTERGVRVALPHRPEGCGISRADDTWRVRVLVNDRVVDCIGVEVYRSKLLPGHVRLRVRRFCPKEQKGDAAHAAVQALRAAAFEGGVLSVNVEVLALDGGRRDTVEELLRDAGFGAVHRPQRYPRTVVVDLGRDSSAILASFHGTARRHIRAARRGPMRIEPITDEAFAPRMEELARESFRRTSGMLEPRDWRALLRLAGACPELSRIVGVFREGWMAPGGLLAFAAGLHHGDHAEYDSAGSTRPADVRRPLGYALAWDLMEWARSLGGRWFDFGGVTAGHHGDTEDELGGISDFKRYFSSAVVDVGGEWVLEARPWRSLLASGLGRTAAALQLRRRRSR
jgi:hypothetical protein